MASGIRVLLSDTSDPWFNLATEDWIFRELDPSLRTLFLWRNRESVVIGRHQNPWVECRVAEMERDGVALARRQSGGGTVFHDLGNSNYTFLAASGQYRQDDNFAVVIAALARLGLSAERSGRNDILVEGFKVSGSAFKHTRGRSFHHGTLLINADLERLENYLNPVARRMEAKGIRSVRSPVANLTRWVPDLDHQKMCSALVDSFCAYYDTGVEPELLDRRSLESIPSLRAYYERMQDWDWRFGRTPEFSLELERRFDWGRVSLTLRVNHGVIEDAEVRPGALDAGFRATLEGALAGAVYRSAELRSRLQELGESDPARAALIEDIADWLGKEGTL